MHKKHTFNVQNIYKVIWLLDIFSIAVTHNHDSVIVPRVALKASFHIVDFTIPEKGGGPTT
jgi:hypothetical protein